MELKVTPWAGETPPTAEELRQELEEQELHVYQWSNDPGDRYAGHTHGYHKIVYVLSGSIKFDMATRHETLTVRTGDKLELPSGIRHSATVGQDGVTCLEAHIY